MAAQIHPHNAVMARERRDPSEIALGAAHRRMQQQQGGRRLPRVGEVTDVIGELRAVARGKALHSGLLDPAAGVAAVVAIIYDLPISSNSGGRAAAKEAL